MTNTLHRKGDEEALKTDFVVFAIPKGDIPDVLAKMIEFTQICLKYKPVNISKVQDMAFRRIDSRRIDEEMKGKVGLEAAFDNISAVAAVIEELGKADLGVSVNVSGLLHEVDECCKSAGLKRHSAEQSLGVFGKKELLPPWPLVEMNSLCGHGLVSFNLIKKVIEEVKIERMTPEEGAYQLAKPCECGAFNPTRAAQILAELRLKS